MSKELKSVQVFLDVQEIHLWFICCQEIQDCIFTSILFYLYGNPMIGNWCKVTFNPILTATREAWIASWGVGGQLLKFCSLGQNSVAQMCLLGFVPVIWIPLNFPWILLEFVPVQSKGIGRVEPLPFLPLHHTGSSPNFVQLNQLTVCFLCSLNLPMSTSLYTCIWVGFSCVMQMLQFRYWGHETVPFNGHCQPLSTDLHTLTTAH